MPIDRGVIDQQLEALGDSSRWWEERELRDLPAVLNADERILALSRGKIARVRWLRRSWLIVVTDRRLLCLRSGGRTSWRQLEVSARQIARVSLRVGLFRGRVVVQAGGHTYRLLVPRPEAYRLESALLSVAAPERGAALGFAPVRMVYRMIDHVLALPAAALNPQPPRPAPSLPPAPAASDERIQSLEAEIQQLREQVDFLEQLLRERHTAAARGEARTDRQLLP